MTRSLLLPLVIAVALAGALARAQESDAMAKEHKMTGCMKKLPLTLPYLLTGVEGKGPKSVGIVSSTINLSWHADQKVEITGTTVPAAEVEKMRPAPSKAPHYMNVTGVKIISKTCE